MALEERSEAIVVALIEAENASQQEQVKRELQRALDEIHVLAEQAQQQPELSQFETRLSRVRAYLESNKAMQVGNGVPAPVAAGDQAGLISSFEQQLFALLERADTESVSQEELERTYQDIKRLMRDISTCRQAIQRQALDDTTRSRLIDRLEDLQENVSDLEHDFGTSATAAHSYAHSIGADSHSLMLAHCSHPTGKKYEASSLEAFTKQKVKEQQVRAAQRQMEEAEDSLFDL